MAEIIITIEKLRYITRSLEGKRAPTDKIRVSIVGEWLYVEDLKTGERVDVRSIGEEAKPKPFAPYVQSTQRLRERRERQQFTKRR